MSKEESPELGKLFGFTLVLIAGIAVLGGSIVSATSAFSLIRHGRSHLAVANLVAGALMALGGIGMLILGIRTLRAPQRWRQVTTQYLAIGTVTLAGPFLALLADLQTLLVVGVLIVVSLGATGLLLRAKGELRAVENPESAARWKASGYFVGALAYLATASVSLMGAAHLLPTQ